MSNHRTFLKNLGFDEDPFAHTNADEEAEILPTYFIPPPYFNTVFGDPDYPKSFLVFAPRGGGKSAQRIMIEKACIDQSVLALTYDRFEFPDADNAKDVRLSDHVYRILQFGLMGILVTLSANRDVVSRLSKNEKEMLLNLFTTYLGDMTEPQLQDTVKALKSLKDKVKEFWTTWFPVAGTAIKVIFKKLLDLDVDAPGTFARMDVRKKQTAKQELENVINLAKKIGFRSIYVLIDRVDESELTGNNVTASFELIQTLLKDLDILELPGIGFKFFLWDQLEPLYNQIARPDRINHKILRWNNEMLEELWQKRLLAHSRGRISGLNQISDNTIPYPPDKLVLFYANKSPRDMLRIGAKIISEQEERSAIDDGICAQAVYDGVKSFSQDRVSELFIFSDRTLKEFKTIGTQTGQVDFTISYLANYIFRELQGTTRNRIKRWREEGVIVEVDRIDVAYSKKKHPVKLFAINDIRIAQVMCGNIPVPDFLDTKVDICPNCGTLVIRDWDQLDSAAICHECRYSWVSQEVLPTKNEANENQLALPNFLTMNEGDDDE
jgi:hypothetical protein